MTSIQAYIQAFVCIQAFPSNAMLFHPMQDDALYHTIDFVGFYSWYFCSDAEAGREGRGGGTGNRPTDHLRKI